MKSSEDSPEEALQASVFEIQSRMIPAIETPLDFEEQYKDIIGRMDQASRTQISGIKDVQRRVGLWASEVYTTRNIGADAARLMVDAERTTDVNVAIGNVTYGAWCIAGITIGQQERGASRFTGKDWEYDLETVDVIVYPLVVAHRGLCLSRSSGYKDLDTYNLATSLSARKEYHRLRGRQPAFGLGSEHTEQMIADEREVQSMIIGFLRRQNIIR